MYENKRKGTPRKNDEEPTLEVAKKRKNKSVYKKKKRKMQYLELLEAKETLINSQRVLCDYAKQLGVVSKQQIYSMAMLTHVTDMGTYENYTTTMIMDETDEDSTIHSFSAFIQVVDFNGYLDLLKLMLKDYEDDKKSKTEPI